MSEGVVSVCSILACYLFLHFYWLYFGLCIYMHVRHGWYHFLTSLCHTFRSVTLCWDSSWRLVPLFSRWFCNASCKSPCVAVSLIMWKWRRVMGSFDLICYWLTWVCLWNGLWLLLLNVPSVLWPMFVEWQERHQACKNLTTAVHWGSLGDLGPSLTWSPQK